MSTLQSRRTVGKRKAVLAQGERLDAQREQVVAGAWVGPTCPGTRSAASASRLTSGVDEWFGLNVFLRHGNNVYRTYFLQHKPMVQWIGSLWSMWSLTPYGGQSDDEDLPDGWPRAPQSFWYRRHDEFDDPPPSARWGVDAGDLP